MIQWFEEYSVLLTWLGSLSLLAFVATLIAIPWIVARIPHNYFTSPHSSSPHRGTRLWLIVFFRNVFGAIFVVAGVLMLVLPGQGILTIVLGISLVDFPAKRPFLYWLVSKRPVYRSLDWLRRKMQSPPLDLPRQN